MSIELQALPFLSYGLYPLKEDEFSKIRKNLSLLREIFKKQNIYNISQRNEIFNLIDKTSKFLFKTDHSFFNRVVYLRQAEKFLYSDFEVLLTADIKSKRLLKHFKASEIKEIKKSAINYTSEFEVFKYFLINSSNISLIDLKSRLYSLFENHEKFSKAINGAFNLLD
ncbi:MAG: hypothetical protein A3F40_00170 [Chlamydiae bacterium RIFCSPHIGHO2_12_FULL_27_8]|nr:MAG: hypothetical protein A3F40_00170 [Chlamydiae bacterium RIFCSPHIGHO2_12_FULL_27_8]